MPKFSHKIILICFIVLIAVLITLFGRKLWFHFWYGSGPHNLSTSLLEVDRGFDFPAGFPTDPGEEGKRSIEGIDSDKDGVRDDVQRWIYALYPTDLKRQGALRQVARMYQRGLASAFDAQTRTTYLRIIDRANQCQELVYAQDDQRAYVEMQHVKAKVFNTYDRSVRWLENNWKVTTKEMSGGLHREERPCEDR